MAHGASEMCVRPADVRPRARRGCAPVPNPATVWSRQTGAAIGPAMTTRRTPVAPRPRCAHGSAELRRVAQGTVRLAARVNGQEVHARRSYLLDGGLEPPQRLGL